MEKVEKTNKQSKQLAATTGFLDQVAIENETVCLSGWVLSFESEEVTNFKVLFGSQQLTGFALTQNLPSPGVSRAHPNISAANNARFIIRLPMNKQQQQEFKDALIILIPLVENCEGEPLLNAVTPALSSLVKTPEANNLPIQTPQVELISVHVPKAAGTAFRQVLLQVYGTQGVLTDKTNMFEDNMPATIHWQTKVIEGHFRAGKYDKLFPNAQRITWLREPIRRLISDYCFRHISNPTKDYLNKEGLLKFAQSNSNLMTYCVNGKSLDYFDFVGITEYFAEDLLELKNTLGWSDYEVIYQNRNPYPEYVEFQKEVLSDKKLMADLAAANSEDMELYAAALKLAEGRSQKFRIQNSEFRSGEEVSSDINLPEKNVVNLQQYPVTEKTELLPILGSLDKAEFDNQELLLTGWVVSPNSGEVKGFKLTIADTRIEKFEAALNLPSPDVEKLHRNLNTSGKARFRLKVPLNPEQISQFQNAQIVLTPIFKDGEGRVLSKVLGNPQKITFPEAPIVSEQPKFIPAIEPITTTSITLSKTQDLKVENQQYSGIDKSISSIVVDSFGYLDKVGISDQKLVIYGWVGSENFGSVEGFKVVIGGKQFTSFAQELGLPSPDIAKVRPKLNNAENSRFRLEIFLSQTELQNCQNSLIALTPIFQGQEGNILFQLFKPSLPIPDDKYIDGGVSNFIPRSFKFLGDFIQRVGLKPTAEVLEIGCGIGNIAYGLSYYLQSPGRYEGFDFSEELISWAQENITTQKPHFSFRQIDSDFQLPYDEKSFDFVFISSRFTQVGGSEIRNYLDEVYRVLKPGGRLLFNCFLVNHESEQLISEGKSSQPLIHRLQEGFTKDPNAPEKGMGFLESLLLEWVNNSGFDVLEKFYGSWCGRVGCKSYPDMLILGKEEGRRKKEEERRKEVRSTKYEIDIEKQEEYRNSEVRNQKLEVDIEKQEEIAEIIYTATSSISPLLTEIMADLEKSQTEIQEIKADLEKFKSKKINTPAKSLFPVEPDKNLSELGEETPTKKKIITNQIEVDTHLPGLGEQTPTKSVEEVNNFSGLGDQTSTEKKQELLGLSGVTVEKFWEIINPVILMAGKRDFSQPSISILTPTWNSSLDWFVETVLSVLNQSIPDWEWCIVDDGSKQPEIRNVLADLAEKELRIKVLFSEDNGGISAATNKALKMAKGEFICLLDHDDTLAPTALENSLHKLAEGFDVVYSDEDKIDFSGLNYIHPFFKPDWSPEYFRGVMYVGHLLCVRREIALAAGGFKSEFDGVQDYEFMLRVSEQTNKIAHISQHLYHWRQVQGSISGDADAKAGIEVVQQAAVNAHLERIGLAAKAEPGLGRHRVNINPLPRNNYPLISLIIATPNISESLIQWVENLLSVSTYPKNEVILIGENGTDNLIQNPAVKVLSLSGNFNYSRAYNLGAKTAQGEYFVFVNTNLELAVNDWQRHLLYYAEQSDVGAVGGFLLFPNGTVEHAGIVLEKLGKVNYVMRGYPTNHDGYAGSLVCAREVSAVSRDCLMVSRENFESVGGFNEHFFYDYQDVDLCLKLRKKGKRILFTPRSVLINHESEKHRQQNYDVVDYMLLLDQWQIDMDLGDPYYQWIMDNG
ncbi:glycosyltransferase [Dapis sp. BLCC M126]|uniref:glycosyltransferase n=1 Tax=Dapis sp. BLCC M126 TaxID=3400189 RepID=UPI003CEFE53D